MLSQYVTAFEVRVNVAEKMALKDAFKLSIDAQLGVDFLKSFVSFIQYLALAPKQRLAYSTLKFMRSTCGKSKLVTIELLRCLRHNFKVLSAPYGETKVESIYHFPNVCESCRQFTRTNLFKN